MSIAIISPGHDRSDRIDALLSLLQNQEIEVDPERGY